MLKLFLVRLVAFCMIPFFLLTSCSEKDDVSVIRQIVKKGAELAEEHNAKGLMKLTTEGFFAMPGHHDHLEVRKILYLAFRHYGAFKVMYPEPGIDLAQSGDSAIGNVYFMIVKKDRSFPNLDELYEDPQGWLEEVGGNADLYRLNLEFLNKNGDWLVKRAHLDSFRGFGFTE